MLEERESSVQSNETCRAVEIVSMTLYVRIFAHFSRPWNVQCQGNSKVSGTLEDYGVSK